jgi:hypothetical protein
LSTSPTLLVLAACRFENTYGTVSNVNLRIYTSPPTTEGSYDRIARSAVRSSFIRLILLGDFSWTIDGIFSETR